MGQFAVAAVSERREPARTHERREETADTKTKLTCYHLAPEPKEWAGVALTQRREKRKTGQAEERFSLNFLECRAILPSQAVGKV